MKVAFADVSSVVPGLTVWSLLAQLWPGDDAPSLFPPAQRFGGPGVPPATAGEVAQTFRSHSEETSAKAKMVKELPVTSGDRVSCEVNSIGATGVKPQLLGRTTICIGTRTVDRAQS